MSPEVNWAFSEKLPRKPTPKQVRDAHLRHLQESIDELIPEIEGEGREVVAAIRRGEISTLPEIRAAVVRLTAVNTSRVTRVLREQLDAAIRYSAAYASQGNPRLEQEGKGAVSAHISREALLDFRKPGWKPSTAGDRLATGALEKGPEEVRKLSSRLHQTQIRSVAESYHGAARAVVDGRALGDAGKRMIDEVERATRGAGTVAGNETLPALVERLRKAGNALSLNAQDPRLAKEWRDAIGQVDRYQATLRTQGRVQAGYLELLERVRRKNGPALVDASCERWLVEKQRYNAERILATEAQAAYRSAQWLRDRDRPWVTGYTWRLQRAGRSDYEKRTKIRVIKAAGGGRGRCVCEVLNGREFSKDAPAEFPHMGHPHCTCWWEPIMDHAMTDPEAFLPPRK